MWVTSCFNKVVVFITTRVRVFFCRMKGGCCYTQKGGEIEPINQRSFFFFFFRTKKKTRDSTFCAVAPYVPTPTTSSLLSGKTQKRKEEKKTPSGEPPLLSRTHTHARTRFFSDPSISVSLCVFIQYASTSWESEQLESACVFWNKIRESSRAHFLCLFFFRLLQAFVCGCESRKQAKKNKEESVNEG